LWPKCTKFDFRFGSSQTPLGGFILKGLLLTVRRVKGKEGEKREGKEEGRERREREEGGGKAP